MYVVVAAVLGISCVGLSRMRLWYLLSVAR